MNLHHLELFYHVCKHGGISRAVRHMPYGIQQPAMSSQILALEEDLGARLFERQPFRLTVEGAELFEFVRPFFEHADTLANRLRRKSAPKLRIAASDIVLSDHLPPIIDEIRSLYPDTRLALRSGYQLQMENWLEAGEIDLAIATVNSTPKAGIKLLPIVQLPLVLLVPKSSPIKTASQLWAQQPLEYPLICLPAGEPITQKFLRGLKALRVDWPIAIEASSSGLVTRYVANGYGLGVSVDLPELVRHPKVRVIPLPGFDSVEIAAFWHPPVNPLITAVLKLIALRAQALWPVKHRR